MNTIYLWEYIYLGIFFVLEAVVLAYLLNDRDIKFENRSWAYTGHSISRKSRITLALLMVIGAAVFYMHTNELISSQEALTEVVGDAFGSSTSFLKLLNLLSSLIFGAAGIALAVTKPS